MTADREKILIIRLREYLKIEKELLPYDQILQVTKNTLFRA